jgi:LSD1 subclass zinc finger protein
MSAAADPYSRCPDCRFIAPPESVEYTLTVDRGIDWDRPVHVTCLLCHARHGVIAADVLQAGAETTCKRCAATVTYPAGAARIRCTGCGLFLLGPDLDELQRA